MYELIETRHFERRLARFRRAHPELRRRILQTFIDLQTDPFQSHLRLHPWRGQLEGLHAVRITHDYRIALTQRVSEREIVLLDISSHDEVYR